MRVGPSQGEYATAALIDDDCKLWPECGCDGDCERVRPIAARPQFLLVEKILLISIVLGAGACLWLAFF